MEKETKKIMNQDVYQLALFYGMLDWKNNHLDLGVDSLHLTSKLEATADGHEPVYEAHQNTMMLEGLDTGIVQRIGDTALTPSLVRAA